MRCAHVMVLGIVLSLSEPCLLSFGQEPRSELPQSPAVRAARKAYELALQSARADYSTKASAAREKYLGAVEIAMKQATRAGDLDEANRLKAEQLDIEAANFEADLSSLWGTWEMRWGQRAITRYQFFKEGIVTRDLANEPQRGTIKRSGRDLLIDFGNNSVMRVNLSGQRLILEYWDRSERFSTNYPDNIGIGTRAAE